MRGGECWLVGPRRRAVMTSGFAACSRTDLLNGTLCCERGAARTMLLCARIVMLCAHVGKTARAHHLVKRGVLVRAQVRRWASAGRRTRHVHRSRLSSGPDGSHVQRDGANLQMLDRHSARRSLRQPGFRRPRCSVAVVGCVRGEVESCLVARQKSQVKQLIDLRWTDRRQCRKSNTKYSALSRLPPG
jgi:hypothetical protein